MESVHHTNGAIVNWIKKINIQNNMEEFVKKEAILHFGSHLELVNKQTIMKKFNI